MPLTVREVIWEKNMPEDVSFIIEAYLANFDDHAAGLRYSQKQITAKPSKRVATLSRMLHLSLDAFQRT